MIAGFNIPTIKDVEIKNTKVLVRVDFDVSINPNHTIANDTRLQQTLPTLEYLLKNNNQLILVSKLNRPDSRDQAHSLKPVAADLENYLTHFKVVLVNDFLSVEGKARLESQKTNEIMLLENIRFYPQEKNNDEEFATQLARLANVYVLDAFAMSHRNEASVIGVEKFLPSYAGLLMTKEINALSEVLKHTQKPFVAIIGGAKVSTKLPLLYRLVEMADYVLIGGSIATTFLAAQGHNVGKSVIEEVQKENIEKLYRHAKEKQTHIILPYDVVCAKSVRAKEDTAFEVAEIPENQLVVDVGPQTEAIWEPIIDKANMIVWNGPVGYIENPNFARGTDFLYYAITQNDHVYSVVGGGDTLAAISHKEYLDKITHISTGGGAMLEFIEKGTLPGIEALRGANKSVGQGRNNISF